MSVTVAGVDSHGSRARVQELQAGDGVSLVEGGDDWAGSCVGGAEINIHTAGCGVGIRGSGAVGGPVGKRSRGARQGRPRSALRSSPVIRSTDSSNHSQDHLAGAGGERILIATGEDAQSETAGSTDGARPARGIDQRVKGTRGKGRTRRQQACIDQRARRPDGHSSGASQQQFVVGRSIQLEPNRTLGACSTQVEVGVGRQRHVPDRVVRVEVQLTRRQAGAHIDEARGRDRTRRDAEDAAVHLGRSGVGVRPGEHEGTRPGFGDAVGESRGDAPCVGDRSTDCQVRATALRTAGDVERAADGSHRFSGIPTEVERAAAAGDASAEGGARGAVGDVSTEGQDARRAKRHDALCRARGADPAKVDAVKGLRLTIQVKRRAAAAIGDGRCGQRQIGARSQLEGAARDRRRTSVRASSIHLPRTRAGLEQAGRISGRVADRTDDVRATRSPARPGESKNFVAGTGKGHSAAEGEDGTGSSGSIEDGSTCGSGEVDDAVGGFIR